MAGKSGRKRKKDRNSPSSKTETQENKRIMADFNRYNSSQTGLTQTQASQFNSQIMPSNFQYTPNMYGNGQPAMMVPQNIVQSPGAQGCSGYSGSGDQSVMSLVLQRLDNMDKKLGQLGEIQISLNKITVKVDDIEGKVNQLETKVRQIENSRDFDSSSVEQINNKQSEIDSLMKRMQKIADDQVEKDNTYKSQI